ncbi:hypothetical protein [Streptomyces sp. NRRL B-24720]|uniref:hypothetical protein n=1 Tax=Streptomyces sp. NRRL B-24720 TaxID=1476876 RepID=UPI0006906FDB|nr:hypothetical protein [Streptomyces sp. NRRL B-24720]
MYKEFVTPDPQDIVNALGVEAEITGDTQRTLKLIDVTGEYLTFSFDSVGRSVSVSWCTSSGKDILRLFREGATLLRVVEEGGETQLLTEFETQDTTAELRVCIFPEVRIADRTLFS